VLASQYPALSAVHLQLHLATNDIPVACLPPHPPHSSKMVNLKWNGFVDQKCLIKGWKLASKEAGDRYLREEWPVAVTVVAVDIFKDFGLGILDILEAPP